VDVDARFIAHEQGYLANRVACLRTGIEIAVEDLTKGLLLSSSQAALEAIVLKVLDDLDHACANKPPLIGAQPTGHVSQSLCRHCERRTGSRTALLCRECKKSLR
jgi:hypothetical protein